MRHLLILNERDLRHPQAGGAEVNLFEVTRRLVASGYAATLICTRFAGAPVEEVIDGIRVLRAGNLLTYYLRLPLLVRRAVTPDTVIIEHLCKLPFCTPLYGGAPTLAVTHHLFGRTAFWQARFVVASAVVAAEWLIPPVYRKSQFVAVSPSTKQDLIARGVPADRIRVIPNGVDCSRCAVGLPRVGSPPTLLALGRVEPYKRIDLILQALTRIQRHIPEARLVVVGGGTGLDAVRADVQRLGLDARVTCTGAVGEHEKLRWIHDADVMLNASEKEGWGLTVLEAAACGVPTVASDVPGLRDAVLNGETGVLVPHGDVEALARESVDLLVHPERRRRLGRNARQWAERFTWDGIAEATADYIEEVAGRPGTGRRFMWFEGTQSETQGGVRYGGGAAG